METELKDYGINNHNQVPEPADEPRGGDSRKDERPLLKSDSNLSSSPLSAENLQELDKKYAAFVRRDVYGTMGRGELPWSEKLLLVFALVTLVPIRVVVAMTILILYSLICRFCTLFTVPNRDEGQENYAHLSGWRRVVIVHAGKFLSRALFFTFGFYWISETRRNADAVEKLAGENVCKEQSEELERPGAIISNHISHMDILYHMCSSFPSFVAKRSVAKLPFVGLMSKCMGCVYVQRESKSSDFKGVSGIVTDRVKEAHQNKNAPMMLLFPEGTTTNGDFLLPFKTGAFLSKSPVLPVILRYPYQRFSPSWDTISGARHVILLLCQFVNHIEVTKLPVYHPSEQEKEDPILYANNVRKLMASEGNLTMSDIGLAEKRIYHATLNGLFCQS
ncbi:lysophospholipid acyltransferase LPEAT1-like isoform X2 [Macadamia integrifolia]|uniref:lysophospholipid acyltransferase LPEAT1-like isoform X2 n=1 Tax=Macadamia integrifolia TaxID=60698 RepID=UPI001C5287E4|nr:lysophospholipid acyltransferase LPEAT1-like isoform X2 [Macadamia integrifolia]